MDSRSVGVLGGGQPGRMMAEAGHRLGIKLTVLDPKGTNSPAGQVGCAAIAASFKDDAHIRELSAQCDVLTVEIEHVDCDSLAKLEQEGKYVQPSSATIRLIQDKYLQKVHLRAHGIATPDFVDTPTVQAVQEAGKEFGYPLMLKARKGEYDGRGNAVVKAEADVEAAFKSLGEKELYAERWAPFEKELAVMLAAKVRWREECIPMRRPWTSKRCTLRRSSSMTLKEAAWTRERSSKHGAW